MKNQVNHQVPPVGAGDPVCADAPTGTRAGLLLAPGDVLYHQGARDGLWRVRSGVIRLDQRGRDQSVLVTVALPGDLVGYETLLGQGHSFTASALLSATVRPVTPKDDAQRQSLIVEALLQQPERSHDMARIRTGSVASRLTAALSLMGIMPQGGLTTLSETDGDRLRQRLPTLRELSELVDANPETICRALATLLPPRSRKSGPRPATQVAAASGELARAASAVASRARQLLVPSPISLTSEVSS